MNGVVRYLLDRLDWIATQPWVEELVVELFEVRDWHLARWPMADRSRPLRGFDCSACGRATVIVHPPARAPHYVEEPILVAPPPAVGGVGPPAPPRPVPVLDWRGRPVLDEHGQPVVRTRRRATYTYPMLVACSDRRCGARVPEQYWEWAARVAETGRRIR